MGYSSSSWFNRKMSESNMTVLLNECNATWPPSSSTPNFRRITTTDVHTIMSCNSLTSRSQSIYPPLVWGRLPRWSILGRSLLWSLAPKYFSSSSKASLIVTSLLLFCNHHKTPSPSICQDPQQSDMSPMPLYHYHYHYCFRHHRQYWHRHLYDCVVMSILSIVLMPQMSLHECLLAPLAWSWGGR